MEKLIKNNLGQWSITEDPLEKANVPTFSHGSIIHVNKAKTNHGYEIFEEKPNGEMKRHDNLRYSHLDSKCKEHNGRIRIEDSKDKSKDLYHQMKVEHIHRTTRDSMLGTRSSVHEYLRPHGEPWKKGVKKEDSED